MRDNPATLNTMQAKTALKVVRRERHQKTARKPAKVRLLLERESEQGRYYVIIIWKMCMPRSNEPASIEGDGIHPASFF
ncbi:MAG: hypothetical protein DME29_03960 [Verrucomicrobia bacterium]|jgi:hypothetical protein|nr:MAG: hypothetical protein DME29_03960 [Verrucomicrobiota bacterium]